MKYTETNICRYKNHFKSETQKLKAEMDQKGKKKKKKEWVKKEKERQIKRKKS